MPLSLHNNEISTNIKYVWLLANLVQSLHIFPCIIIFPQIHQIVQKVDFFCYPRATCYIATMTVGDMNKFTGNSRMFHRHPVTKLVVT